MGERDESIGWFLVLALTSAHCPGHARVSTPLRALPKVREMAAALGSAFQLRAAARPALTRRGKKTSTKARARATPVRAASTEPKIESVAAAVPSDAFLPEGLYCVDNTKTVRRKTRCVLFASTTTRPSSPQLRVIRPTHATAVPTGASSRADFRAEGPAADRASHPRFDPTGPSPSATSRWDPITPSSARR